ncbi:MAG: hypothetical protein KAI29_26975, partial [Cyclobacteriaceae bacterium]|nr:hypothetical protein [Cyclobacteriaceae bacterium]
DNSLKYSDNYSISDLSDLKGDITILGLSPHNDSHIFKRMQENENLKSVLYYFYDEHECGLMESKLFGKKITFQSVRKLWNSL